MNAGKKRSSSDSQLRHDQEVSSPNNKKGCLLLLLGGLGVIVVVYAFLIYMFSTTHTPEHEANERNTIAACWEKARDPAASPIAKQTTQENCEEMEKQFKNKYGRTP